MSSKDKDGKSLQDKFKNYFKSKNNTGSYPGPVTYMINPEVERDISPSAPLSKRLKNLKDLEGKVLSVRLESPGVERIWKNIKDLVCPEQPRDTRHAVLGFVKNLVLGQYEELTIMRTILFNFIVGHEVPEDAEHRFLLLQTLTDNGKNIKGFEEEIGRFILDWMPKFPSHIKDFLELTVNIVKYNAAYLDDDIVCDIVCECCQLCCYSESGEVVLICLRALETIVCYSVFPHAALKMFVGTLCRTINCPQYCQTSWKIMRNMLGTDLGYATLFETVEMLHCESSDAGMRRGAVFYIYMALWDTKRVTTLKVTYTSILPAFMAALDGQHSVVTYEVILALQNLISKCGSDLHEAAWEMIFHIIMKIVAQSEKAEIKSNKLIQAELQELVNSIEQQYQQRQYTGDVHSLHRLIDAIPDRPEASVMRLVTWRAAQINPALPDWLGEMSTLLERYCRLEKRPAVRAHTLRVVHDMILLYRGPYEEEVVERVVLPHAAQSALDADTEVRLLTAQLVVELALLCHSKCCSDLLDITEKVLNRPFDLYVTNDTISLPSDPKTVADIKCVVEGLIKVFHWKLLVLPSSHAVKCYLILLSHLEKHYSRPSLFQYHPNIRLKILEVFLSARANRYCHIGFCYDSSDNALLGSVGLRAKAVFSPYVCVEGAVTVSECGKVGSHSPSSNSQQQHVSYVSIRKACNIIVQCLVKERNWSVLQVVLREIGSLMQNKPLVLSKDTKDIDTLATALCSMVTNANAELLEGAKLTTSDFNGHVLPVLAYLAPYHLYLEPQTQQKIVKCLIKYGLVLRMPQQCIGALSMYTLETRDTMVKLLPEVLLKMSHISDTSHIAVPILEFLSTLTRLPKMFASFVADQYMSVFAILLPYTNPSRYNHYVVSLAHHVIAAWFLKCRLSYRRDFVSFIIHGLRNFILLPIEEAKIFNRSVASNLNINEDSSNRMRSSSLGSKGREPLSRNAHAGGADVVRSPASASAAFHQELTETCVDLMARYTFSPCTVRPRRGATAEFIFAGGQSSTWVVGHEVVTITTSGCQQNSLRHGLCDRCLALCKQQAEWMSPGLLAGNSDLTDQPELKRQNSSENRSASSDGAQHKTVDNSADTQAQLSLKLENLAKQEERGAAGWWRPAGATCVCWCSGWVEVLIRRPTGDVSWVMRMQNTMSFDSSTEMPLNDIISLLAPSVQGGSSLGPGSCNMSSSRSSGLGDSRNDILSDTDARSRSNSYSSQHKSTQYSPSGPAPAPAPAQADLAVPTNHHQPSPNRGHGTTEPIDIPSPQRQSSSSTTTDDDTAPVYSQQGKSRHPVRRSNSSPEMSSSWKLNEGKMRENSPPPPSHQESRPGEMIVLPGVEPPGGPCAHKKCKHKDMRVSCEAIPEETSGTPPAPAPAPPAHHHLATYNSDPGSTEPESTNVAGIATVCSDTALNTLVAHSDGLAAHNLHKQSSDGKVVAKPPQSPGPAPAPASPGRARPAPRPGVLLKLEPDKDDLPPLSRSKRSNTISVMSPTRRRRENATATRESQQQRGSTGSGGGGSGGGGGGGGGACGGGVTPAFVLLQLYHNMNVGSAAASHPAAPVSGGCGLGEWTERPLLVSGVQHERSVKNLDITPPIETYTVGVLYVAAGQTEETQILKNDFGSIRYGEFLRDLGTLIAVEDIEKHGLYVNTERGGRDGSFALVWQDDIMQVHFHVATLMPNNANDPTANEKRKHIGNNYVSIVYNDSGADFNINTIKGQFNFCIVMVEPLEHGINRVTVKTKEGRIDPKFVLGVGECKVISNQNVALLARQTALHCTLASLISRSLTDSKHVPYASNSLERLRIIKRLRARLLQERSARQEAAHTPAYPPDIHKRLNMDDFTEYT